MDSSTQEGDAPSQLPSQGAPESSVMRSVSVVVHDRKILFGAAAIGVTIGLAIAVLSPRHFTTTFSFMPQTASDGGRAGLASLAGQFGVNIGSITGQATPPQFYADLLGTRAILVPIATDSVPREDGTRGYEPLSAVLDSRDETPVEQLERTVKRLRDNVISTEVATRTTGVVSVKVETRSAAASLIIAQQLLAGLNKFNLETRQSQAAAERRFVEGRLDVAKAALADAEGSLRTFQEGNRAIGNSPSLTFKQDRLQRDVTTAQDLVATLTQQYEDARIREVRDTPVITVIDRPVLAARADPRGAARIVLGSATVALILALCFVLSRDRLRRELAVHGMESWTSLMQDPQQSETRSA